MTSFAPRATSGSSSKSVSSSPASAAALLRFFKSQIQSAMLRPDIAKYQGMTGHIETDKNAKEARRNTRLFRREGGLHSNTRLSDNMCRNGSYQKWEFAFFLHSIAEIVKI